MREILIKRLEVLRGEVVDANAEVLKASDYLHVAKSILQDTEDSLLTGGSIDGKNAEIRAAQMREFTSDERAKVYMAEIALDAAKTALLNRQAELRIDLALVELVKGVA